MLVVSVLPRDESKQHHLLHFVTQPPPVGTARIQLLESAEYRYEIEGSFSGRVETDRPEIFQPDAKSGLTGRIRTGLHTGSLAVSVKVDGDRSQPMEFEVRSSKLEYLTDYRWMLRDLSDELTEIVLNAFGPTQQKRDIVQNEDASTLYHRFCFLRGLLETERFQESVLRIVASPYRTWESEQCERDIGSGIRASSSVARQIASGGMRRSAPSTRFTTLPSKLHTERSEETLDNVPNRFVKYALLRWRSEVSHIIGILEASKRSAPINRGIDEANAVIGYLDRTLSAPLFREVGELNQPIGANQVLQRKEGYREVLVALLQSELASQMTWTGGEDVFDAGQRNVAGLYEYWVFLKLAKVVSELCHIPFSFASLFTATDQGLRLGLKRGESHVLSGEISRLGRTIEVEMYFNHTFEAPADSWSREMRPDYSIVLNPKSADSTWHQPVQIHFDAKYRIDKIEELFGHKQGIDKESDVKRTDLLKMHAYKDAIHSSSGAYVLYPGTGEEPPFMEYDEVLPGIGAFRLRPSEDGDGIGISQITAFLNRTVSHVATQLTRDERDRFWRTKAWSERTRSLPAHNAPFLGGPPMDSVVLIGPVRSVEESAWINQNQSYGLPLDGNGSVGLTPQEISASLLILPDPQSEFATIWSIVGEPLSVAHWGVDASAHPHFQQPGHLTLRLSRVENQYWNRKIRNSDIEAVLPSPSRPMATTWARLVEEFYRMGVDI